MKRKWLAGILGVGLVFLLGMSAAAADDYFGFKMVNVTLNGKSLPAAPPAINVNGTVYVPAKTVADAIGYTFAFDPATNNATMAPAPAPALTEGIRGFQWGTTKATVKQKETATFLDDSGKLLLYGDISINNLNWGIGYEFSDDKLASASYVLLTKHVNSNQYVTDFNNMKALLSQKYGKPVRDDAVWNGGDFLKSNPDNYGLAVAGGYLKYITVWETKETRVALVLMGEKFESNLGIRYESISLSNALKQNQNQQTLNNL